MWEKNEGYIGWTPSSVEAATRASRANITLEEQFHKVCTQIFLNYESVTINENIEVLNTINAYLHLIIQILVHYSIE